MILRALTYIFIGCMVSLAVFCITNRSFVEVMVSNINGSAVECHTGDGIIYVQIVGANEAWEMVLIPDMTLSIPASDKTVYTVHSDDVRIIKERS